MRYYPAEREETPWSDIIQDNTAHTFCIDQLQSAAQQLEQGFNALSRGLARFGFRALTREESFAALYEVINFSQAPAYRTDLSLNMQLAHSFIEFHSKEEYLVVNDTEYISVIGINDPPPTTVAMYLRRLYELGFPLIMRQAIGFADKEKLLKEQNRNRKIAMTLNPMAF